MGQPINWWDRTTTPNGFTLVLLHGLKKLGNFFTEEEELGMFHLWKYISYLLGVPEEYLPDNKKADRKSTRLNSSHVRISYAVFCLKKKKKKKKITKIIYYITHTILYSYF